MRHETDEEIVRRVMASTESTLTERELAVRIRFLLEAYDVMEEMFVNGQKEQPLGRAH